MSIAENLQYRGNILTLLYSNLPVNVPTDSALMKPDNVEICENLRWTLPNAIFSPTALFQIWHPSSFNFKMADADVNEDLLDYEEEETTEQVNSR